jgi:hypothetical protein
MNKKIIIIGVFLLSSLLFSINCGFTTAFSDADEDSIDDEFEHLNKREIEYVIDGNEISVESIRKGDKKKDLISTIIVYNEDGVQFQIGYKSTLESEYDIIFRITFREIIEYIDMDMDDIYNPEIDQNIQNFSLNEFSPLLYENSTCPSGSVIHHFQIQTENQTFIAHIYFAEEFTLVENALILPSQVRINIEISNFTYVNTSSQLALYTRLDSETNFEIQEDTEDEINGYAENEKEVITSTDGKVGFLSWNGDAKIDNFSKNVLSSEITPDDHIGTSEKLYNNYLNGTQIFHSYKIGIEDMLIYVTNPSPIPLMIFIIVIGALSAVVSYSIYHARQQERITKSHKRPGEEDYMEILESEEIDYLFDSKLALQILEEKDAIEKLYNKGEISLTIISSDFYEKIDKLGIPKDEKEEFIKEMLSLHPKERDLFLQELMIDIQ